jgi:hypothetical protein
LFAHARILGEQDIRRASKTASQMSLIIVAS